MSFMRTRSDSEAERSANETLATEALLAQVPLYAYFTPPLHQLYTSFTPQLYTCIAPALHLFRATGSLAASGNSSLLGAADVGVP